MSYYLKNRFRRLLAVFCINLLLYSVNAVAEDTATSRATSQGFSGKHTLVISKVTENPKKHYRYLKPMADYMVKHMKDLGINEAKFLMARDNRQMVSFLKQGRVDWITETPFSAIIYHDKAGAELLLRKWKKGVPDYYTIFFTRKDSGINSLADLRGKTIAFEDPGSTSAYFVPASVLIREGLNLVWLASPREKPPEDMVGYVFSGQEINTSTWVHKGIADTGAFNNLDWNKDDHLPKAFRKDMKIFYKTRPFPRAIELVRKGLDPKIKQRLKEVLLHVHNDPKAKAALRAYHKTTKFDELDAKTWASLDEVRRILKIVQSELE